MPTFLNLYSQILDELDRPNLVPQAKLAIQSAVQQYKQKPFWFTEAFFTFSTVRAQEYYGVDDDPNIATAPEIKRITGLFFNFRIPLDKQEWTYIDDISGIPTSYAMPERWAYAAEQIRLWPIPDRAYTLTCFYTPLLTALANDQDNNVWTNEAFDVIRCRAKVILIRNTIRDPDMEVEAQQITAEEQTYLKALIDENSSRKATGQIQPTMF